MEKRVFKIKASVSSREEIEDIILEINNCEFCNAGTFEIKLIKVEIVKKYGSTIATGEIELIFEENIDINSKLDELFYCEFCHNDLNYFSIA